MVGGIILLIVLLIAIMVVASCVKIVPQAQAYVVERAGDLSGTWASACTLKCRSWTRWQRESC